MATHDYVIANASGAAVRADLNNALAAIVSNNSGSSEPGTTYAFQWWADTNASQLKLRNAANDDWVVIQELDGTMLMENGTVGSPGLAFASDLDTGFFRPAANQLAVATNGVERVEFGTTEVVFNDGGNDINLRVEGDTDANLLFVDAGNDRIGISTNAPAQVLHLNPAADCYVTLQPGSTDGNSGFLFPNSAGTQKGVILFDTDNDFMQFSTNDTERMRIVSGGATRFTPEGSTANPYLEIDTSGDNVRLKAERDSGTNRLVLHTTSGGTSSEAARFDESGRLLVGTSTARANFLNGSVTATHQVEGSGTGSERANLSIINNSSSEIPGGLFLGRSKGDSVGSNTLTANNDWVGRLSFLGNDGAEFVEAARISSFVDGISGSNDMPGRLVFSTTADGASSPVERMTINRLGQVDIGETNNGYLIVKTPSGPPLQLNRTGSDGHLVRFFNDSSQVGDIHVSGSLVTFNGAHLTRWSQLAGNGERIEILRGTVLSNLDEMCEWSHAAQDAVLYTDEDAIPEGFKVGDVKTPAVEAYTEDNEQLNRMKISDVEGDKNVAGVFESWDDEDDTFTGDFYCSMNGDHVIRIGKDVTVARGDLLMSAGDGTAKPQDDDVVRSKTVAKVTSTTVSETYADGSYCVPCVLMAG